MNESQVRVEKVSGIPVVTLCGADGGVSAVADLQEAVGSLSSAGSTTVIFDGRGLNAMSDVLLGSLTVIGAALRDRGGRLRICLGESDEVREPWRSLDLASLIPVHNTPDDAVAAVYGTAEEGESEGAEVRE